jgi:hypothetical protein
MNFGPSSRRHSSGSIHFWIVAALMICASPVFSQVDASTPKSALKSLYAAVQNGDATTIRQLLIVQNDPQQQIANAYADLILAGKRLGDVASHKFPGSSNAFAQGALLPEDAAKIDSADLTVDGDTAKLKFAEQQSPIVLKQTDAGWRLFVEQSDDTPKHHADQLLLLHAMTDAMNKSADEIDADKYATVEDAESAVKNRLGAVVSKALQSDISTSKPASQP